MSLDEIVAAIMAKPGPLRLVAVDGPGGAGKSTFARELAAAAGGAPVVHTDDFAAADNPIDWWPRLLEQVIEPLAEVSQRATSATTGRQKPWPSGTRSSLPRSSSSRESRPAVPSGQRTSAF